MNGSAEGPWLRREGHAIYNWAHLITRSLSGFRCSVFQTRFSCALSRCFGQGPEGSTYTLQGPANSTRTGSPRMTRDVLVANTSPIPAWPCSLIKLGNQASARQNAPVARRRAHKHHHIGDREFGTSTSRPHDSTPDCASCVSPRYVETRYGLPKQWGGKCCGLGSGTA